MQQNSPTSKGVAVPANVREWSHYPIQMPLTADDKGPATVGKDAVKVTYEVWDQLYNSHGSFDCLPDAINEALRLTVEGDKANVTELPNF